MSPAVPELLLWVSSRHLRTPPHLTPLKTPLSQLALRPANQTRCQSNASVSHIYIEVKNSEYDKICILLIETIPKQNVLNKTRRMVYVFSVDTLVLSLVDGKLMFACSCDIWWHLSVFTLQLIQFTSGKRQKRIQRQKTAR